MRVSTKFALRASEVIFDSEVVLRTVKFRSEREVGKLNFTWFERPNFTVSVSEQLHFGVSQNFTPECANTLRGFVISGHS